METHTECIICGLNTYGTALITKLPEGISFCLNCVENHRDDKNEGRGVYIIGQGFVTVPSEN